MKEPIICIYGIKDLRTDKIIYIGQTKNLVNIELKIQKNIKNKTIIII